MTIRIEPSSDSMALIAAAVSGARSIWRDGYRYPKAGVVFVELYERQNLPEQLLPSRAPERSDRLMAARDHLEASRGDDQ